MSAAEPRVLAVCTGNICRSPFAAAYLARLAAERGIALETASAGTHALDGNPPTPEAVAAAKRYGIDLSGHRARRLSLQDLEDADWVLAMTKSHAELVRSLTVAMPPALRPALEILDVPDPFGRGLDAYERCYAALAERLQAFVPRVGGA